MTSIDFKGLSGPSDGVRDALAEEGWLVEPLTDGSLPLNWKLVPLPEPKPVKPVLIGLGGWKTSGKDALSDFLVEDHPDEFVKIGMSDPLHEMLLTLDPLVRLDQDEKKGFYGESWRNGPGAVGYGTLTEALGYVEAKKINDYRRLLQVFATDIVRNKIGADTWVRLARERIEKLMAEGKSVIVTAIRFPNELELVHELLGTLIWVDRPGVNAPEGSHESEISLGRGDFDLGLANNQDLQFLHNASRDIYTTVHEYQK